MGKHVENTASNGHKDDRGNTQTEPVEESDDGRHDMADNIEKQFAQSPFDWRYHCVLPGHTRPPGIVEAICGHLMPQTVQIVSKPHVGALLCEDGCMDRPESAGADRKEPDLTYPTYPRSALVGPPGLADPGMSQTGMGSCATG